MSTLVKFLDHPELKETALEALRKITGKDFGFDRKKWTQFFEYEDGF